MGVSFPRALGTGATRPALRAGRPTGRGRFWRDTGLAYLYLLPAFAVILVFHLLPVFYAFWVSLHTWGIAQGRFLGAANYERLLTDPQFLNALGVTVWFVLGTVPVEIAFALLIACLLFQPIRARGLYRTVYFLPYVTSAVAAAAVWTWIFNPQYGILNAALGALGVPAQKWLQEPSGVFELIAGAWGIALPDWAAGPSLALVAICIFTIWQGLGFDVVIFLAGLGNIARDLYEAGRIDGASERQLFRHITLPLLSPTTFFLIVIGTIRAFQSFNQVYVMSVDRRGGPLGTTELLTVFIYNTFYGSTRLGYASAAAFILFAIILLLTLIQLRYLGRRVEYG